MLNGCSIFLSFWASYSIAWPRCKRSFVSNNWCLVRRFDGSTVRRFDGSTVRRFDGSTVRRFDGSTVRPVVRIKKQPIRNPVIWCSLANQQLSYKKNSYVLAQRKIVPALRKIECAAVTVSLFTGEVCHFLLIYYDYFYSRKHSSRS